MKIDVYEDTYGGLKRICRRLLGPGNTIRWANRVWYVYRQKGVWMLGAQA